MICFCGTEFQKPERKRGLAKKYCSQRCNVRAWRAADPERAARTAAVAIEKMRLKRAAHPEIFRAKEAARYASDPVGQRARIAAYRAIPENRKRGNAVTAAWRAANPAKAHAAVRRWEANHPESVAHYRAGYRARRTGNGGSHTAAEWRAKCAFYENRCFYCGSAKRLSRDHDIPLSRGGTDDITNILPACRLCNSKKRTRTAAEYLALLPTNDATTALLRIA